MLTQVLTASTEMFKENIRVISLIEDKAQKAATLAGIFLAAGFSFLRKDTVADLFAVTGWTGIVLLWAAVLLMLGCLLGCGFTLKARTMLTPPPPEEILTKVNQRLAAGPEVSLFERQERNLREQAQAWQAAIEAQDKATSEKARLLQITQLLLITGVAFVAALLILSGYAYGLSRPADPKVLKGGL